MFVKRAMWVVSPGFSRRRTLGVLLLLLVVAVMLCAPAGAWAGVSQYNIGGGGALSPKSPPIVNAGGAPYGLAVSPDGKSVYVANRSNGPDGVSQYDIGAGGGLKPKAPPTVTTGNLPIWVAASPDGKSVYVANYTSNDVSQYNVGPGGVLSAKGKPVAAGASPRGIVASPDGKSVYAINYFSNNVSQYNVGPGGVLSSKAAGPLPVGASPLAVAISPDGKTVYVTRFTSPGSVLQFDVGAGGALSANGGGPVPAGAGPYPLGIAVSPDSKSVYVTNNSDNTVSQYGVVGGVLRAKSAGPVPTGSQPLGIAVTPDGKSVYVVNTGDGTVSQYDADSVSGALSGKGPGPVATGSQPQGVAVSPDGKSVYVTHSTSASTGGVAPANTTRPVVENADFRATPVPGSDIRCLDDAWSGTDPITYRYEWLRDGTLISGATGNARFVTQDDVGHTIACRVTATNAYGSASATSDGMAVPIPPPKNTSAPPLVERQPDPANPPGNAPQVGENAYCFEGGWSGQGPITYAYEWFRDGAAIPSSGGGQFYPVVLADAGHAIACRVTATNAGGSASATSNGILVPVPAPPVNTSAPPLVERQPDPANPPGNAPQVGENAYCFEGGWSGQGPITYAYEWFRDGAAIPSSGGGKFYPVVLADAGHAIACRVTATNAGGSASATSNGILVPVPPPPVNVSAPEVISLASLSDPKVGDRLACLPGSWDNVPRRVYTYVWLRDASVIYPSGFHTIDRADLGHRLACRETATNDAGSASATSDRLYVPTPASIAELNQVQNAVSLLTGCQARVACQLTFTLTADNPTRTRATAAVAAKKRKPPVIVVGSKTVRIAAGRKRTVIVTLNRTGRGLLRRGRKLRVKLSVTDARASRAGAPLAIRTITLRSAARMKG